MCNRFFVIYKARDVRHAMFQCVAPARAFYAHITIINSVLRACLVGGRDLLEAVRRTGIPLVLVRMVL